MLMLSGIQHFAFCPRQWALIHLDQQWDDNRLTAEGVILHQHADEPSYRQKCGDAICLRHVNIASKELGLYGYSDIIELHPATDEKNAICHPKYPGSWMPYPIEYKHGKPKRDNVDAVQLCAQAMCLEEQYGIEIHEGAIYYGEIRRREIVPFDGELRSEVSAFAHEMHEVYVSGQLPKAEKSSSCKNCSLKDICMPESASGQSATEYLKENLYA